MIVKQILVQGNDLKTNPELSFILPAYNEQDNIKQIAERMDQIMRPTKIKYEVIVVNDGSRDETAKRAFEYSKYNGHVRVLSYKKNMGKGYAIKAGFLKATGDIVVFIDSDLDIDPIQIDQYVEALKYGDIATASKRHPQSYVEMPLLRKISSLGFNMLVRSLTGLKMNDTQAGLKVCKRNRLEKVLSIVSVKRFAFDVEFFAVANLCGLKIIEMPVNIQVRNDSFKAKEILNMFIDLLGITYRLKSNKYYKKLNHDRGNVV